MLYLRPPSTHSHSTLQGIISIWHYINYTPRFFPHPPLHHRACFQLPSITHTLFILSSLYSILPLITRGSMPPPWVDRSCGVSFTDTNASLMPQRLVALTTPPIVESNFSSWVEQCISSANFFFYALQYLKHSLLAFSACSAQLLSGSHAYCGTLCSVLGGIHSFHTFDAPLIDIMSLPAASTYFVVDAIMHSYAPHLYAQAAWHDWHYTAPFLTLSAGLVNSSRCYI